ncbi:MAG: zinc-dependent alcohol dehydrogenase [Candidatus Dormibacteria bacterium]
MQALVFDPSPARLPLAGLAARVGPGPALGPWSLLSLRRLPLPAPPAPGWVRLRVLTGGICGSDVKQVLLQAAADNPLSGLISFPHVMGHEVVGRVEEPGQGPKAGTLVVLDPWVGCRVRGEEPLCEACARGFPPLCRHQPEGGPWGDGHGMHLGNIRGLPGGFAQRLWAHPSQCHVLPGGLPPRLGILADPLAVALHAVERAPVDGQGPVLILGAGTIGMALTLAARRRWPARPTWVTAAWPHQLAPIAALGAEALPASARLVVPLVGRRTAAVSVSPWRGGPWLLGGGVELVLDSIGSRQTTELALRCLAPGGRIVVVGVAKPERTETTLAYYKEAEIIGCNGYGLGQGSSGHLLDRALEILEQRQAELGAWVTHHFPLRAYRRAFRVAARPGRYRAIKVGLDLAEEVGP